jgi:tetratricopeptide (TPR) repeat protein
MFDLGAKYFNEKQFDKAFNAFKYALFAKDFMIAKNYTYTNITLYPLDTALVLNTAISAMQSKNEEQTVKYYRMLTDANVSGESYMEVYEYLADLYTKKEDKENQQAMIEKGKQLYPNNDYWYLLELDAMRDKVDQPTMFAKYEEVIAKNPKNFVVPYNYSIEMYNAIWGRDSKGGDQTAMKEKLTATLKLAVENDKGIDATVLLSKHLYNLSSDLSIAANMVKGTKPEDVKKRADLVAKTNQQMDEFLIYADKASVYLDAQPKLKGAQKGAYNEMMASMIEVYTYKKNTAKAAEIQKKKDALDN